MKKILLSAMVAGLLLVSNSSKADPCYFGNIGVKVNNISPGPVPGTCVVNFDLYFDVLHNAGGKFFWIHIWKTSLHPVFNYAKPPTTSLIPAGNGVLDNSLTTFGYFHQGTALIPQVTYLPDPNVPGFQSGYTLTEIQGTPDRYTAHGLTITLPEGCDVAQSLTADAWESQAANSQTVACYTTNIPFYLNDPTITGGLLFCQLPRTYKFDIATLSATNKTVNYEVRIDNGDGFYNSTMDNIVIKSGTEIINSATPFHSGIQTYLPYSNQKPEADRALWVIVLHNSTDIPNDVFARIDNTCIPLPVSFTSFTAQRKKQVVELNWVTGNEINNRGFYVERKSGLNDWQAIGYVASQALAGTSSETLQYTYTDINSLNTVCQYRLRQVDLDNKITYSETRMVKGIDQAGGVLVFPNPTNNGQLTVVLDQFLEGANLKLVDMNGRNVKQWDNIRQNRFEITGIPSGIYLLQVWPKDSREPIVTKVMVNK